MKGWHEGLSTDHIFCNANGAGYHDVMLLRDGEPVGGWRLGVDADGFQAVSVWSNQDMGNIPHHDLVIHVAYWLRRQMTWVTR